MKRNRIFSILIFIFFNACSTRTKTGEIVIKYEATTNTERGIIIKKNTSINLMDTIVFRFLSGFSNESIKVCFNGKCDDYNAIKTDPSVAFASSVLFPIKTKEKEVRKVKLVLRGLAYYIILKRDYRFIDFDIGKNNILTVTYSNNILLLS